MSNDSANIPASDGQDGSGNPNTNRAYLQDEPPVQVDPDASTEPADASTDEAGDEPGDNADAARS